MKAHSNIHKVTFKPLSNSTAQALHDDLVAMGYKINVNKKEYAEIVGCSTSAIDTYIAKGYGIPKYFKIGLKRNSRVLFSLRDVAEYLSSQTTQIA